MDTTSLEAANAALRRQVGQLGEAMASRAGIEQAKGILMLRYGVSDEGAFQLLSRWSSHHNVKVRSLAEALVRLCQHDGTVVDLDAWFDRRLRDELNRVAVRATA